MGSRCVAGGGASSQQFSAAEVMKVAATLIYLGGSEKQLEDSKAGQGGEARVAMQRRGRQEGTSHSR